jgi:hypothetical protein
VVTQIWRGVIVHSADALSLRTKAYAAVLHVGESAVLTGPTALELHGITAAPSADIHIAVDCSKRARSKPGLVVRQKRFDSAEVIELDGLPVFSLAETLADSLCDGDRLVSFACLDQALNGLSAKHDRELRSAVARRLDRRVDRRGVVRARMSMQLATGKADSPPESMLRFLVVEAGLPIPAVQYEICTIDGRRLYVLDMAWPEVRIALEYDGYAAHEGRESSDRERDERMAGRGWITIRATAADLPDPARIIKELRAAFARRSG